MSFNIYPACKENVSVDFFIGAKDNLCEDNISLPKFASYFGRCFLIDSGRLSIVFLFQEEFLR